MMFGKRYVDSGPFRVHNFVRLPGQYNIPVSLISWTDRNMHIVKNKILFGCIDSLIAKATATDKMRQQWQ